MADEVLATIAKALAKDMAEAGEESTGSMAGFAESTAEKAAQAGKNVAEAGAKEADSAQKLLDLLAETQVAADTSDAYRSGPKKRPAYYPTGPIISIDRFKAILGRAGFGELAAKYDFEYSSQILDDDGFPAYGVSPASGTGPDLGANGKPVIRLSDMALENVQEAVTTFFHEVYHQDSWARYHVPGGEISANAYGEAKWEELKSRFGF